MGVTALAVAYHETISLTDLLILIGVLGYLLDRLVDAKGWSRTSRTLRRENEDLVRRNRELEDSVARLETTITEQGDQLRLLEAKVQELQQRDQQAVLASLERHERGAKDRHAENQQVLQKMLAVLEGGTT